MNKRILAVPALLFAGLVGLASDPCVHRSAAAEASEATAAAPANGKPPTGIADASGPGRQQEQQAADAEAAAPKDAPALAWGEPVEGLQAGVGFHGGDRHAYRIGESVPLVAKLRNVGGEAVTVSFSSARLRFVRPLVEDAQRERPRIQMPPAVRYVFPTVKKVLKPGEEMTFDRVQLKLASGDPGRVQSPHLIAAPGDYTIRYTIPLIDPDTAVATGRLKLTVKGDAAKIEEGKVNVGSR